MNIMDWLVHGGHQYEFFKTGPNFYCANKAGNPPKATDFGRPKNKNVEYIYEKEALQKDIDLIMIRSGIKESRREPIRRKNRNIPGIAVMQTHAPFKPPHWARCVVWNSKVCMDKYRKSFSRQEHFYIPHGFDPNEFLKKDNVRRNGRILSANSAFEARKNLLGFESWKFVSRITKKCDLLGHANDDIKECIGSHPLNELVDIYNDYSVYLNTTTHSAMPRARAEALMCGMPLVTTNNYGISRYLKDGVNCLFADDKHDMVKCCNKILNSDELQRALSFEARKTAIKRFHINDYIEKWKHVFKRALR